MSDISRTKRECEHIETITVPSPGAVGGEMCMVEDMIGVWQESYDTGDTGVLIVESEDIILPKAAGEVFAVGDFVFYDPTTFNLKASASGYWRVGRAKVAAGALATTVEVDFYGHDPIYVP